MTTENYDSEIQMEVELVFSALIF